MTNDAPALTLARLARLLESGAAPLSLPHYRVLGLLAAGEVRATQLASRLAVAKPTLTAIVDSLVERGCVTREPLPGDRRVVRLSITPAGRTALADTDAALRAVLDDVLRRCADPATVLAALDDLGQALDARSIERAAAAASQGPQPSLAR